MAKVIALFNQKGGVGKTTTAVNLCSALCSLDKKVLGIDFDPQSNATSGVNIDKNNVESGTYNVLIEDADIKEAIIKTEVKNLDFLAAGIDLAGAEIEIANMPKRESVLKRRLSKVLDDYDYIIIDCAPSLGLLPINALAAADSVLIPIQCEYYALEGVSQLMNTINLVKRGINPSLAIEGILLTMYDTRTNLSGLVVDEVKNFFRNKVFKTIIPRSVRLAEAPSYGKSILEYDKNSKGAIAYINLAKEIIKGE